VNAVLDPVTGLDDAVALLRFCLDHGYQLRIIEQMPLDAGHEWQRGRAIAANDVLRTLQRHFDLRPDPAPRGSAPAQLWEVVGPPGVVGKVGIIASVSHAFCAACDRVRLTADGQIRNCLFARDETDLRQLLRAGADDDALAIAWRAAMWVKAAGHGINDPGFVQPDRPMSAIGG
jgi:cyclic pyranopterin phosphate synthase